MIRPCTVGDAAAVCDVYNHYVRNTVVTFEETAVSAEEMAGRIETTVRRFPWLVHEERGAVIGYAYASPWKTRSAYRFAVESTIYLAPGCTGRGIGTGLYSALLAELRARSLHCAIGGIALPNPASVALHEKLGFEPVARFAEVGWKFGAWIDVGYWERIL